MPIFTELYQNSLGVTEENHMIPIDLYDVAAMLQTFILKIFVSNLGPAPEIVCFFLTHLKQILGQYLEQITTDSFQILSKSSVILPFDAIRTVQLWTASLIRHAHTEFSVRQTVFDRDSTLCTFRIRSKRISTHSVRIRTITSNILLDIAYLLQLSIWLVSSRTISQLYTEKYGARAL